MTVQELIEELKKFPMEANVVAPVWYAGIPGDAEVYWSEHNKEVMISGEG